MSQNKIVVTANGFLKSHGTKFINGKPKTVTEYTPHLRYAKLFGSGAKKMLTILGVPGFVYNPWEQEPVRDRFVVTRKRLDWNSPKTEMQEFIVERAVMLHETDARFLWYRNLGTDDTLTKAEAIKEMIRLNKEMMKNLAEKTKAIALQLKEERKMEKILKATRPSVRP